MIALYWAIYWERPEPYQYWLAWFWTLDGLLLIVAFWGGRITEIDVGAEAVTFRRPIRSRVAAMEDVLRVDAFQVPWKIVARRQPPLYRIDVWLTAYRHWRFDNIEPEAGYRLLATLHARQKLIWFFPAT